MDDVAKVILVPHDGKTPSDKALRYAIDIAEGKGISIMLIKIMPQLLDISDMSHWTPAQRRRVKKVMECRRKKVLEQEYRKLEKRISSINLKGVKATSLVVEGTDVADQLIKVIKKEKPYIVVIGSSKLKSRGILKIKMLGSVARKLSMESTKPVLIVK
jgi:nucleotide-binding universal stress UspA family protein